MNSFDVAVVGGGAAGLSAALVLSRARRTVVAVDAGSPRNAPAAHMHGYLSREGLPPTDFLTVGREEVTGYGGQILSGTVTGLVRDEPAGFGVVLAGGERLSARRLLVTTGLRDELPDLPGLGERWARDVLHCPYCHGYEVRDRPLGVIGGTPGSVRYAQIVRQWSRDLVYFTPPGLLTAVERAQFSARGVDVVEGPIARLVVDHDRLVGVELADGLVIPREVLFVPPRFMPQHRMLLGLGCAVDSEGWVITDPTGRTSLPGVWAAGNVADPRAQVITAAGAGSAAAIALNADLVDDDINKLMPHADPERGGVTTTAVSAASLTHSL